MCRRLARRVRVLALFFLVFIVGCGAARYPVSGRVTYEDGTPVEQGNVVGEATVNGKLVAVQGSISKDGSYSWGANYPGEGALPGDYKVIVQPRELGEQEISAGKLPDVDSKYGKYESSGLKFEVKPEKNEFNIKVSRPKPKPKAAVQVKDKEN